MRHVLISLVCVGLVCLLSCMDASAQATAEIGGTVRDQTGAVLPGVEITATQTGTGSTRNTISNETGSYILPNLPIGPYRLEAVLPGFRSYVQTGIVLQVDGRPTINIILEVGQVTEAIEVSAGAAQVETRSMGVAQVMETERILELPLNGRQVESLITLSGAAVQTAAMSNRAYGGERIAVAGGLIFGVDYQLDGANHMNYGSLSGHKLPFPDALGEFNLRTSGLTADAATGSSVSAVTKSGTNELHGTLFEFVRNDLFNARNYFAVTGSTLKRNQFGGTLGGPILQNKLFFFGAYQGTTIRQDPADLEAFLPTPAMLAGDWTTFASTQCQNRAVALRTPFVNNRIDPALFSPAALNIVKKLPKTDDPCGRFRYGSAQKTNDHQIVGRLDYQQSVSHSMFGRYFIAKEKTPSSWKTNPDNILLAPEVEFDSQVQSVALGSTYLLRSNMVNSFRATYLRLLIARRGNEWFSACDMGIKIYCGLGHRHMGLSIAGGFNLNQASRPNDHIYTQTFDVADDFSLMRGNHQTSFGVGLNSTIHNAISGSQAAGRLSFTTRHTNLGLGDFLTGQLSEFSQGLWAHFPRRVFTRAHVTDVWKATPRLTFSAGLRWEPYLPESRKNKANYNFDYLRFQQRIESTVYDNAPAGFYYPGDPGFPNGTAGQNKQWLNFSPRLGLAWDVTGDGRTSVRASYAYSYENVGMEWAGWQIAAPPFGNLYGGVDPVGGLDDPWRGLGDPFPGVLNLERNVPFGPNGEYVTMPYDMNVPRTGTWNLTVQRELPSNLFMSLSYLGSLTTHIQGAEMLNPAIYIPGGPCVLPDGRTYNPCSTTATTALRRKLSLERYQDGQFIGNLVDIMPGTQSYNGMLVTVRSRPVAGVNINSNYTWSHCVGDRGIGTTRTASAGIAPNADVYVKPGDRKYDFGDCDADRRHIFNLTGVLETPTFSQRTLRALATGWRLAVIHRRSSGSPLTVQIGNDIALNGIAGQRPHQILGDVFADESAGPMEFYLNRDAFQNPAAGTFGNLRRNAFVGPSTWAFDLSLSRTFNIRENHRVEVRAEAYNVTNSFRPTNPNTNLTSSFFGQFRGSFDPRIMQFALKYVF
jgi:hypothetical protein